ncbi:phosphonoacetaldehyde hydrolase [Benzoatithermus flavus]|uniref:Phosphonoacetaldehyde hydrolase n=1 Tax=Benzoatithermus flavus TaxID=3108223 RepID=A0ABU8XWN9_9PROT
MSQRLQHLKHLKAVVLDWAGTMVDHGSLAPMGVFVEAFRRFGVEITIDEARGPMGLPKRAHIAALLAQPRIAEAWRQAHGRLPGEAEIDAVYEVFVPMTVEVAAHYADLVPGAAATVRTLRALGLKIGSSTGYTHDIVARILPIAAEQGYAPDCVVCAGDTPDGRPTPLMLYKTLLELAVWPTWACVKVDDTEVGIEEGLNGGAWTVGVAVTGNLTGLSLAAWQALGAAEQAERRARATARLAAVGAHYVVDGVADLLPVIHTIEGRLARGERP